MHGFGRDYCYWFFRLYSRGLAIGLARSSRGLAIGLARSSRGLAIGLARSSRGLANGLARSSRGLANGLARSSRGLAKDLFERAGQRIGAAFERIRHRIGAIFERIRCQTRKANLDFTQILPGCTFDLGTLVVGQFDYNFFLISHWNSSVILFVFYLFKLRTFMFKANLMPDEFVQESLQKSL